MKRITIAKSLAISAAITLTTLAVAPTATAGDKRCSNATLKGTFADRDIGAIAGVGPMAGANLETFDGNGKATGSGVSSVNGYVSANTFSGTYQVNADCTGTYSVHDPQGNTYSAFFVIGDNGNELQIVVTNPGTAISCVARKQFPEGDSER